jgi:lipopolysaccharide export system protein LptC
MASRPHDNLHSRMVAWLKVVLPLIALALLSTLFLFSRGVDPEDAIPYADVDVQDRMAEPRMVGAGFSGKTANGAALTLTASEARPGEGDQITASDVSASVQFPKGGAINLTAASADLRGQAESAHLSGGVVVTDEAGYRIEAKGLTLSTKGILAQSDGPILATGPLGRMTADEMTVTSQKDSPKDVEMVFKGRVTVLYIPPKDLP